MSTLFVFDGMKRPSFAVKIDMETSTVADIFREVAKSYDLELDPRKHLRIVFAGKELKFSKKKKLNDVGIINHSTIAVIFRLPDRIPTTATATESMTLKTGEKGKDANDVSIPEDISWPNMSEKEEEENKDAEDVSVAESKPLTTVEESKHAEDVSVADYKPLTTDEESKDAEDVSVAESKPLTTVEESKDAEDVSVAEYKPLTADEESKDAEDVSVAESKPLTTDEESQHAEDASVAESKPLTTDEESKDAENISVAESKPLTTDEESKNSANVTMLSNTVGSNSGEIPGTAGKVEKKVKRPVLQRLPGIIELTFRPDFMDFDMTQLRAILPCFHVMGSETMRSYCENLINMGTVKFLCPYLLFPFLLDACPAVWDYTLVRHVACFTTKEMHDTEKNIAINFIGKDLSTITCPGCFTWCSKADRKLPRLRCFVCTKAMGREFVFCGDCLGEWKNVSSGSCANPKCKSIDATLDILRNSRVTNLYGGTWPVMRLCPRCGILTEFMGGCSQDHCRSCGYYYCFICLKGAKSKAELQCIPYNSDCQRAPLQTSIPEWDGHSSD